MASQLDRSAAAILTALWERPGELVSKDELLEIGWRGRIVHENSLVKAIGRIRPKLERAGDYSLEAVYGSGYRLDRLEGAHAADKPGAVSFLARLRGLLELRWRVSYIGIFGLAGAIAAGVTYSSLASAPAHSDHQEAEALIRFISDDLILPTDPYAEVPSQPALRQVVERAADTMDERFAGQPKALLALNMVLGKAFSGWGEYDRSVVHFAAARTLALETYPGDHSRIVEIDALACQQMRLAGQTREAERTCSRAAEKGAEIGSQHHPGALANLGKLRFETGNYADAVRMFDEVLESASGPAPSVKADALWFRALSYRKLGRFSDAERDFLAHLEMRQELHGRQHPLTAWAYSDYGDFLAYIGDYPRATKQLTAAREIFERRLGPEHVETMSPDYSLAMLHAETGDLGGAEAILDRMLDAYSAKLGRKHFWTIYVMTELALVRAQLRKFEDARALLREARANAAGELHGRPAKAAWFHLRWSRAMAEIGDKETARDELRRARSKIRQSLPDGHPWLARADCLEARVEMISGNRGSAQAALAECSRGLERAGVPASYPTRLVHARLTSQLAAR